MTGSIIIGKRFHTLEQVQNAIRNYSREQAVPYVIINSTKADTYNKSVAPDKWMPLDQGYKDMVVACKHYGQARQFKHKPGTQKRGNQKTFKRHCVAKFNLCYNVKEKCHIVSKLEERHINHQPDINLAKHYPENRRAPKEIEDKVRTLFENEAKPHRIRDVVLNSGVLATGQDIQNLRNKWLASFKEKKESPEEALFKQFEKMKEEDPKSVVVIHFDKDTSVIQSLFFQTSYMRESLEHYPELLIMDTTYKLCDNEMPLIVFSVVDCFGAGRIAGYAIIFAENKQIVTSALKVLKLGYDKLVNEVKVIYVDKAQSEIASIKEILPGAEVHLCDYHVKDTFCRNYVKKMVKENWEEIHEIVRNMIHAHTKEVYDNMYQKLNQTAGKDSDFMKYFNKNWHNCGLVWSDYQRNESFTLGERTTGRVESHNGKIKMMVDKKLPVSEVVLRLCVLNRNASIENSQRVFNEMSKTKYHRYSQDPVLQQILKVNTPFVGNFLRAQYERSLEPPSRTNHEVTFETCDCKYFKQSKLICSHIFRMRRLNGEEIYDHKLVPPRWTVIMPSASAQESFRDFEIITSPIKVSKSKKVMSHEERYNLAESISKRISSYVANFGGHEFHCRINALQNFEDLMRMGKRVEVVGVDGEGQLDMEQIKSSDRSNSNKTSSDTGKAQKEDRQKELSDIDLTHPVKDIFVSENHDQESYSVLTEADKKKLKLPVKCPIPGRPKGMRSKLKKNRPIKVLDSIEEENVDDVDPEDNQCPSCNGPLICRTSCNKANQGRKFKICQNNKLPECSASHKWLDKDYEENVKDMQTNTCIVCALTGPPSADGGHKCNTCGDPVHALNDAPCCSIATNLEDGYGGYGRKCLKCVAKAVDTSSTSSFLKEIDIPTIPVGDVSGLVDNCGNIQLIGCLADPSQDTIAYNNYAASVIETPFVIPPERQHVTVRRKLDEQQQIVKQEPKVLSEIEFIDLTENEDDMQVAERDSDSEDIYTLNCFLNSTPLSNTKSDRISDFSSPASSVSATPSSKTKSDLIGDCSSPASSLSNTRKRKTSIDGCISPPSSPEINIPTTTSATTTTTSSSVLKKVCFGCGTEAVLRTSTKAKSYGQKFYTCPTSINANAPSKCRWINWVKWERPTNPQKTIDHYLKDRAVGSDSRPVTDIGDGQALPSLVTHTDVCLSALEDLCTVCNEINNEECVKCDLCKGQVHSTFECSIPKPVANGVPDSTRLCRNCYCKGCQTVRDSDHICKCRMCEVPFPGLQTCSSCWRYVCQKCSQIREVNLVLCTLCIAAKENSVSKLMLTDIVNMKHLSDEHMTRASNILCEQFGVDLEGLKTPLQVHFGISLDKTSLNFYEKASGKKDYVQLINTGREHWVTAIIKKGSSTVYIMDSNRQASISGFTEIQSAMLLQTQAFSFCLVRPPCKQQTNSVDCGVFAIANAVQFAFTREIRFFDFDSSLMRDHLVNCFQDQCFTEFPKLSSRPKKVREETEYVTVRVYCSCRLPECLSNMVQCDKCHKYFHILCLDNVTEDMLSSVWFCSQCEKELLELPM